MPIYSIILGLGEGQGIKYTQPDSVVEGAEKSPAEDKTEQKGRVRPRKLTMFSVQKYDYPLL